jgi:DNA-binding NtrC family response regulator
LGILEKHVEIDLLFTDIVMPGGLNGIELGLAASKLNLKLKVLYCSGYAQSAVLSEALLDKEVRFLSKPYTLRELAKTIRGALAKSSSPHEREGADA